jgi:hypothetical protein
VLVLLVVRNPSDHRLPLAPPLAPPLPDCHRYGKCCAQQVKNDCGRTA